MRTDIVVIMPCHTIGGLKQCYDPFVCLSAQFVRWLNDMPASNCHERGMSFLDRQWKLLSTALERVDIVYLTVQMYHEEMLKQSPRQQLFNDYARQLMRRYPQLKQEIVSRLSHVNDQWTEVMNGLVLPPGVGCHDTSTMLFGAFSFYPRRIAQLLSCSYSSFSWGLCFY